MLEHALRLLASGLSVIPLKPRPEPDPGEVAKQPAFAWKLYQSRQPTEAEARQWWSDGSRGMGIVTGAISGIVVLDLDCDGAVEWAKANLPETPVVVFTSRGQHWYYGHPGGTVPNGADVFKTKEKLGWAIDVRADGGQVLAPPTVHPNGSTYRWLNEPSGKWTATLPRFRAEWLEEGRKSTIPLIGIMSTKNNAGKAGRQTPFLDLALVLGQLAAQSVWQRLKTRPHPA